MMILKIIDKLWINKPRVLVWYFYKIDQVLDIYVQDHNPQFQHRQTNSQLLVGSIFSTKKHMNAYELHFLIVGLNKSILRRQRYKKDPFLGQDQQEIAHHQPNKYFRRQI